RLVDAELDVVDPLKVRCVGRRQLLPRSAAIARDENAGAAQRQAGAANLFAEISFTGAREHHVRLLRIDRQRVDGNVGQAVAARTPRGAVVIALPHAARYAGRKQRCRHGWMELDDTRAAADVARTERRPGVEKNSGADPLTAGDDLRS